MEKAKDLVKKHGLLRAAQFGIAGIIGFLALEGILVAGLYIIYGTTALPTNFASSPTLLTLDVVASVLGVVVGFFVNERTTVRELNLGGGGARSTLVRLGKFEGVYAVGSAITIGVQLALLGSFGLSPAVGNVAGAIAAYPVSYFVSMKFVWRSLVSPTVQSRA
jgi:putative flippase GtrA